MHKQAMNQATALTPPQPLPERMPHQGVKEMARRVKQLAKAEAKKKQND